MRFSHAALRAALVLACSGPAVASSELSLADAYERTLQSHPELSVYDSTLRVLDADRARAMLRPPLVVEGEVEDIGGTGDASGINGVQATVSLGSVFERGGKRDARLALVARRVDAVALIRSAKRLDLLAETARRYLDSTSAAALASIAREDVAQRAATMAAAQKRLDAGASPRSVVLAARAARTRAEIDVQRAEALRQSAARRLAALWGSTASIEIGAADPMRLPPIVSFDELAAAVESTPDLTTFASEERIREARLQLARTGRIADIEWRVGVRRSERDDDWSLVGTVSVPLGSAQRAAPEIMAAEAELAAISLERESKHRTLLGTLAEAHGRYLVHAERVRAISEDLLPGLQEAAVESERAYRAGAISFLEWTQVLTDITSARRDRLEAAIEAQRALIEIERLTGLPVLASDGTETP